MLIAVALFLIAFSALWQSYRDPQVNLSFLSENATALAFLCLFVAIGVLLINHLQRIAYGGTDGLYMLGVVFSWGGLILLWFLRKHPKDRKPPDFLLMPLGVADKGLLTIAGLCVFMLVW